MKFSVKSNQPERKPVAVLGTYGMWFNVKDKIKYLTCNGSVSTSKCQSLQEILVSDSDYKPIYEGDVVEIQF